MKTIAIFVSRFLLWFFTAISIFAFPGVSSAQERFTGTNVDSRISLYYRVPDSQLLKLVPDGWELSKMLAGPAAGSNVMVTFIDQLIAQNPTDAVGTPVRYVLFYIVVKKVGTETSNLMLFTGLSPGGAGPYATNLKAVDEVKRSISYRKDETLAEENWSLKADSGESVSLEMIYARGALSREKAESRVYSQVKPEFSRIYRYEQGVDLLRGSGVTGERLKKVSFKASGGKFSNLFDGREQLIGVSSIPWYSREIYLPVAR